MKAQTYCVSEDAGNVPDRVGEAKVKGLLLGACERIHVDRVADVK